MASFINKFLAKYDQKPINDDGAYGQQCMDVYARFQRDLWGTVQGAPSAVQVWNSYPTDKFIKIPNTPSGVPIRGDVMVWGTGVGQYGHIAIVIDATVNSFTSFDQNWPFDNGNGVAHYQWHNYSGVLGWLRPRVDVNFDQEAADAAARAAAEAARLEAERVAREAAAQAEAALLEAERVAREAEEARLAAQAEADRKQQEQARIEREEAEARAKAQAEADRLAKEQEEAANAAIPPVVEPPKQTLLEAIIEFIKSIIERITWKK